MKKLGKISINPEKVIKNEELVNLKGGYDGCARFYCECTGSVGTWEATYCSTEAMVQSIYDWCASHTGNCVQI